MPLVQAEAPDTAVATAEALHAGGLGIIEVVFRTDAALECLAAVSARVGGVIAGAGTVLNAEQARSAIDAGARFIVSPGLDTGVVDVTLEAGLPVFPGICTPSELQHAVNLGLDVVKFFPATIAGGIPAIKALASVFRSARFMPTGGISSANLAEFLCVPSVLACGGSWLTPPRAIAEGNFAVVTTLAKEALAIASATRSER